MSDLTGAWLLTLAPDGTGNTTIPQGTTLRATLEQVNPESSLLSFGRLLWGTLSTDDIAFLPRPIDIPRLQNNNGSKTGSVLGCELAINVPVAEVVSDDNKDQGPLRIQLGGEVTGPGEMKGNPMTSKIIMAADGPNAQPRRFAWTAQLQ
jgi:hypothetical protein